MVEWKKLGEVCEVLRGKRLTKSQLSETDGYPVLHGGSMPMGYYSEYNRKANTTVVVNTGNAGCVFFYDKKFWSSDACFSLYPNEKIMDKFLYLYVYGCERILKGKIRAGAMPTIDAKAVEDLIIPLPSLSEQEHIVGILDTFTSSIENLKAQISLRRKQYEHYRDKLLDLEGKPGVEMKTLGEVCEIGDGLHGTPDYDDNGDYFFINGNNLSDGQVIIKADTKKVGEDMYIKYGIELDDTSILMSINGTIGNIAIYKNEKIVLGKSAAFFNVKRTNVLQHKYLYYFLQTTESNEYYESKLTGSTIKNLGLKALRGFPIPLPSLEEQSRIVSILDEFEASIKNLEAQLEAREKQYEYYREKLLTFE